MDGWMGGWVSDCLFVCSFLSWVLCLVCVPVFAGPFGPRDVGHWSKTSSVDVGAEGAVEVGCWKSYHTLTKQNPAFCRAPINSI